MCLKDLLFDWSPELSSGFRYCGGLPQQLPHRKSLLDLETKWTSRIDVPFKRKFEALLYSLLHAAHIPGKYPVFSATAATITMSTYPDPDFPCSMSLPPPNPPLPVSPSSNPRHRTISVPLPTARLASAALQSLRVDEELSPLVRRSFSTVTPSPGTRGETVLRTEYKATTNRMLRVAVNGFMESLGVVLGVMEELDVDVLGKD